MWCNNFSIISDCLTKWTKDMVLGGEPVGGGWGCGVFFVWCEGGRIPWKLREIFALLSPKAFTALQRQFPPSAIVGLDISRLRRYESFPKSFLVIFILSVRLTSFVPWNHFISGRGWASNMHSITSKSPFCWIVGFFGKRGAFPSGILHMIHYVKILG